MDLLNKLLLGGILTFCQAAIAVEPKGLDISIKYDGKFGYDLILQNKNSYFVCVTRNSVNTYDKLLTLKNDKGEKLIQRSYKEAGLYDTELGVDFLESYFIVRPGESKDFYLSMSNFELHEGKYQYSLKLLAFKCKDMVDESRVKARRNVKSILLEKEGTIEFDKKFIELNNEHREQNKNRLPPAL